MRNIKLTIAYDGTNYYGFQEQRGTGRITVQEVLEKTLTNLAGSRIKVHGAGRTDSGVHARGQVINFDCAAWPIPTERIEKALNGALPWDIAVLGAEEVSPEFHARISARAKTYVYVIYNNSVPSPFEARYSYFIPASLDLEAMQKAASYLVGTHDFKAFRASNSTVKTTVRTIFKSEVSHRGEKIYFTFFGDGFLYNMVRIFVGTLLKVGEGKMQADCIPGILNSRDRREAGPTAPAHGLFLEKVHYNE